MYVDGGTNGPGRFIMSGGTISGNTAEASNGPTGAFGGGVDVRDGGSFEMSGGVIRGNRTAGNQSRYGGGVSITDTGSSFVKTGGGTIFGNNALPEEANNAAPGNTWGHAVFYAFGGPFFRDTTLEEGDDISTSLVPPLPAGTTQFNWTRR